MSAAATVNAARTPAIKRVRKLTSSKAQAHDAQTHRDGLRACRPRTRPSRGRGRGRRGIARAAPPGETERQAARFLRLRYLAMEKKPAARTASVSLLPLGATD